ncbi:MAG TPA: helix-turn-helix transcriptional regulator [Tepidisphaeraceae bacterium]|nr:helix-turn-helix transcriptional regulator [Tepidisphaeraceae bacterium]
MTTKKSSASSNSSLEERILGGPLTFAAAVEGLRVGEELSQAAFARKLGVSRQYLCDVEKGRRLVSVQQAARFAKAFGHPPLVLVRLALQDAVRASGLKVKVSVEAA